MTLAHRDFPFPLNAIAHVLAQEDASADALHYGLFESPEESMAAAQRRSTAILLQRLPAPPCRVLDVGTGLGATLARLTALGFDAEGVNPDERQIAAAQSRFGESLRIHRAALESFQTPNRFDAILFQESSQYIDSAQLFETVRGLAAPAARVVVLDEFALRSVERPGALHRLDQFLAAAERRGFRWEEEIDLSRQAAPTVDYFLDRLPRFRERLVADLGIGPDQIEGLIESGRAYRELYRTGAYGYRLLAFRA